MTVSGLTNASKPFDGQTPPNHLGVLTGQLPNVIDALMSLDECYTDPQRAGCYFMYYNEEPGRVDTGSYCCTIRQRSMYQFHMI